MRWVFYMAAIGHVKLVFLNANIESISQVKTLTGAANIAWIPVTVPLQET